MDQVADLLSEILSELREMNGKMDDIMGSGLYNSITDVCNKLDDVESKLSSIDFNTM